MKHIIPEKHTPIKTPPDHTIRKPGVFRSPFVKDGTAQGIAKHRLIETLASAEKRIIHDPFADKFVFGSSLIKFFGHKLNVWLSQKLVPGFHEHIIARTKYIDDLVINSCKMDAEQYVILGAGYDSRAHRLPLPSSIKIFEVDQPEVQERKRAKLSHAKRLRNINYIPIDFNQQSLIDQLIAHGLDPSTSTIITLEGVLQYIPKNAAATTIKDLAAIAKKSRTTLFLSYADELLTSNPEACCGSGYPNALKRVQFITNGSQAVGEPWISFYTAEEMNDLLKTHGFFIKHNVTLADLNANIFRRKGREVREDQLFNIERFVVATSDPDANTPPIVIPQPRQSFYSK